MPTLFSLLCTATGLTPREVARLLDVHVDTVCAWNSGKKQAPEECCEFMSTIADAIAHLSDSAVDALEESVELNRSYTHKIGIATNDEEAAEYGYFTAAVQKSVTSRIIAQAFARGIPFELVPYRDANIHFPMDYHIGDDLHEDGDDQDYESEEAGSSLLPDEDEIPSSEKLINSIMMLPKH